MSLSGGRQAGLRGRGRVPGGPDGVDGWYLLELSSRDNKHLAGLGYRVLGKPLRSRELAAASVVEA